MTRKQATRQKNDQSPTAGRIWVPRSGPQLARNIKQVVQYQPHRNSSYPAFRRSVSACSAPFGTIDSLCPVISLAPRENVT